MLRYNVCHTRFDVSESLFIMSKVIVYYVLYLNPMYQILKCAYLKYISPMEIKSYDRWEIL